ncbi:MAG: TerB family tellurite resistance protein [Gammaproteobacteria bacterium]|nr:MAG: TerB family tellurite resistance protein [Gammaproteobacteria bacterium]
MISRIKVFFEQHLSVVNVESEEAIEHRLQLASAVLLIEVAQADRDYSQQEKEKIQQAIASKFYLTAQEIEQLMTLAREKSHQATDYHQFTSLLNKEFTKQQKIRLIEMMWHVAYADGELDPYEDHLIRKISELLYLRHSELLWAREQAKSVLNR